MNMTGNGSLAPNAVAIAQLRASGWLAEHDAALVAEHSKKVIEEIAVTALVDSEAFPDSNVANYVARWVRGFDDDRDDYETVCKGVVDVAERDAARAEAAASQAIIERIRAYIEPHKMDHDHPEGEACSGPTYRTRESRDIDAILAAAPSDALTTDRAERWDEALEHIWELSDPAWSLYEGAGSVEVMTEADYRQAKSENPYRVTPTEEHYDA